MTSSSGQGGVIDREVLATSTFGSVDLQREVLGMYVTQSTGILQKLAVCDKRLEQGELAHTLKGSSRSIGAMDVARVCQELEEALSGDADVSLVPLEEAVAMANAEIQSILSE